MDWGVEGVAGTPAFRAPEGARDARADIYALGALLEFTLQGLKSPPPALLAVTGKAMSPDPAGRYPDAAAVLAEIKRYRNGEAVLAHRESPWQAIDRWAGRNAVLLWLLAAYAAAKFLAYFLRGV
jgi:serine/threonine protein kinase